MDRADGAWTASQAAFAEAATWFARVAADADGHWGEPGLGEWTVQDLVGHTSRALLTVETYLDSPAAAIAVSSPVDYFRLIMASGGDPAAVAQRGRDAAAALGAEPASEVARIADRVLPRVDAADADDLVTTPVGGMRLVDYLPTRTFKLTVHTCDLVVALGQTLDVPERAAAASLTVVAGLAARDDKAGPLLLAATGSNGLPEGFTVL